MNKLNEILNIIEKRLISNPSILSKNRDIEDVIKESELIQTLTKPTNVLKSQDQKAQQIKLIERGIDILEIDTDFYNLSDGRKDLKSNTLNEVSTYNDYITKIWKDNIRRGANN